VVPRRRRPGYTLLELILVVVLIVAVTALAFPGLYSMYSYYKLEASGDAIRAAWSNGRTHAVDEGRRYRFAVVPGKGNYRIAPESAEFWQGGASGGGDPENPAYVFEDALTSGIRFQFGNNNDADGDSAMEVGSVSPDQWVTVAIFEVDGTAQEDVEIALTSPDVAVPLLIKLRAATGISTRERGEAK